MSPAILAPTRGVKYQEFNQGSLVLKKVAVIGLSFRFPGTDRLSYWDELLAGRDLISEVDPSRWSIDAFKHPLRSNRGTSYSFAAGSLGDISGFDAGFFGISPREAAQMDPQQRLMLELAWEAFENAGVKPSSLRGSDTGVYVGISSGDYGMRMADDLGALDSLMITGNTSSIAANRISYLFDLQGPSIALDTACSSSLVAFHQACRSIATGECAVALAGGVSLHLHPLGFVAFSKASMLSRKGRCNAFDAAGDGYVRSEGGGVFVLKDLELANADGDMVLAIVAGSAINTDGKKSGLTVPSRRAQSQLLTDAYKRANIHPGEIDYIEAHGTGTPVGDPIEAGALGDALGKHRPKGSPLLIGSVKTNLGHLEAASGVAGMVKALHCIMHRVVPATIHLNNPNPDIPFDDWNLHVVTQNRHLPATGRLIVGVNSFGFGGANAHVILESPVSKVTAISATASSLPRSVALPVVVSGKSAAALKAAATALASFLRSSPASSLYDIAGTSIFKREWHEHRAIAFGATHKSLALALECFATNQEQDTSIVTANAMVAPVAIAFVYSGNGAQWEGMGRRLLAEDPVFKAAVLAVEQSFEKYADFSLVDELAGKNGDDRYVRTEIAQPALFAIQVGITEMLRSRGVRPTLVTGHSVGEVAAAWASGALTLEQAVQVIFHRSQLQGRTRGKGQMTAVALGATAMQDILESTNLDTSICIAGINSARGVSLAGTVPALDELESTLTTRGIGFKRLDLDYAFHGPMMDDMQAELRNSLSLLRPRAATIPMVSTVTGCRLAGHELDAEYWWLNIRRPVQFESAIASALDGGSTLFIEIGPHSILKGYIDSITKDRPESSGRTIPTLARGDDAPDLVWAAASHAILAGAPVDLSHHFPRAGRLAPLPDYPWQREPHWHAVTSVSHKVLQRTSVHPLLGYRMTQSEFTWENQFDTQLQPVLADHVVGGAIVFPGTAFAEMALAVAVQFHAHDTAQTDFLEVEELEIKSPLLLSKETAKGVRTNLNPADGSFWIKARDKFSDDPWALHASGRILGESGFASTAARASVDIPTREPDFTGKEHCALVHAVGLEYGPGFEAIECGWIAPKMVWARLRVPDAVKPELASYILHPSLLDSAFQLVVHLLQDQVSGTAPAYLPTRIGCLTVHRKGAHPAMVCVNMLRATPHSLSADFTLFDAAGNWVASALAVRFRSIPMHKEAADHVQLLEYAMVAQPRPGSRTQAVQGLSDSVARAMRELSLDMCTDPVLQDYLQTVEPLLDGLCASFAYQALRRLAGATAVLTDDRATELIENRDTLAQLFVWMVSALEEDELLVREPSGWRFTDPETVTDPAVIWNDLLAKHPDHFALVNSVGRVGMRLFDLFMGNVDAAQLRTNGLTTRNALPKLLGSGAWSLLNQSLTRCIHDAMERLAPGARLQIAEFCEDAPHFAAALLHGMADKPLNYLVMAGEREADNKAIGANDHLPGSATARRCVLAIDQPVDPLHLASRDVIVMVQGFGSPPLLQQALRQARQMLAPGGVLLFFGLPATRWPHLVFGTHQSWWVDDRSNGLPDLTAQQPAWQQLLCNEGFVPSEPVPMAGDALTGLAAPAFFVATTVAQLGTHAIVPSNPATPGVWVILHGDTPDQTSFAAALAGHLQALGVPNLLLPRTEESDWTQADAVASCLRQLQSQYGGIAGLVDLPPSWVRSMTDARWSESDPLPWLSHRCEVAAAMAKACDALETPLAAWFVTHSEEGLEDAAETRALTAFVRVLRNEPTRLQARVIHLDAQGLDTIANDSLARSLLSEMFLPDLESELELRADGARLVPRLRHAPRHRVDAGPAAHPGNAHLTFSTPGQLRNLRWESATHTEPGPGQIRIDVEATGLNFRDVMYALGMLSDESVESGFAGATLGLECAGIVGAVGAGVNSFTPGDRVVAFAGACFGRSVTTLASAAARIPGTISAEAAATIPTTFLTAYYALHHLARLRTGECVLIHGAAGGVGIAAIQIARHFGAVIFATAGSDEKRDFLRLLGADHVLDSRSLAFADEIMAITDGRGIDVVLNSLAGEAINRNLRILKPFGRFLELGKRDFYENTKIGLRPFRNNISYFGIDADQLLIEQPELSQRLFYEVIALFSSGVLHPLPFTTFDANHVLDAFRHMQQARHIGKVVVTYRDGINHIHRPQARRNALRLPPEATYLVTGGLGGFGLRTARWLVDKGARHLVLAGRTGPVTDEAVTAIAQLEAGGAQVCAIACDISDPQAAQSMFSMMAIHLPPLHGVIHAAAVFEDAMVTNTDNDRMRRVFAPKALGAWNLHHLSAGLPLDFFVMYSSVTTAFGNPGQGAYVAANAWLESLALQRRSSGLPALCVRWGPIDDVGYLARNTVIKEALQSRTGGKALPSAVALDLLEELMITDRSGLCVADLNWRTMARFLPSASEPKYGDMASAGADLDIADEQGEDISRMLRELSPVALSAAFRTMLKSEIGEILRIAPERIDDDGSVYDLGLDSLMGVELALAIESRFGAKLPIMVLSDSPTVAKLTERIIAQLTDGPDEPDAADSAMLHAHVQSTVSQHAVEVDPGAVAQFAIDLHASGMQSAHKRIIN